MLICNRCQIDYRRCKCIKLSVSLVTETSEPSGNVASRPATGKTMMRTSKRTVKAENES